MMSYPSQHHWQSLSKAPNDFRRIGFGHKKNLGRFDLLVHQPICDGSETERWFLLRSRVSLPYIFVWLFDESAGDAAWAYCLHSRWLDDVFPFREHCEDCFSFMYHALLLFIVFVAFTPLSAVELGIDKGKWCFLLFPGCFVTHPWKCCHQLKDWTAASCSDIKKWLIFYMARFTAEFAYVDSISLGNWVLTA